MAYPLIVEPEADLDLFCAYRAYEDARRGLGARFLRYVDEAFDRIAASPEIYAFTYNNVRHKLVRKFPYIVCYTFESGEVSVVAVYHGHRNPEDWKLRVH